ncbi:hypothetical protein HanIR_Chr01g0005481 [Helianthus annuus]|nr:hypothetical protein HanIR_Chr01g0005481 [Helianthus annuus]
MLVLGRLDPMKSSHFLLKLQEALLQEVGWVIEFSLQLKVVPPNAVMKCMRSPPTNSHEEKLRCHAKQLPFEKIISLF